MKRVGLFIMAIIVMGCGKQSAPPVPQTKAIAPAPASTQEIQPPTDMPAVANPGAPPSVAEVPKVPTSGGAVLPNEAAMALATQSGCLACHTIERKVVGPAWKDVSRRYQKEATARSLLIEKVKKGGKGSWIEVTGGIPMPPYSPRVTDENIGKLVDFILSLEKT